MHIVATFPIWLAGVLLLFSLESYAQDALEKKKQALELIRDFAAKSCAEIPRVRTEEKLELSGEARVELGAIAKKLTDLGFAGAARYINSTESRAVTEADLATALKDSDKCRMYYFDQLVKEFLAAAPKKHRILVQAAAADSLDWRRLLSKYPPTGEIKLKINGKVVARGFPLDWDQQEIVLEEGDHIFQYDVELDPFGQSVPAVSESCKGIIRVTRGEMFVPKVVVGQNGYTGFVLSCALVAQS